MENQTADAEGRAHHVATPDVPDNLDRILIGVCAAIWLFALGAGVAATVALVALGRGRPGTVPEESGTPWLLYIVIGVSAIVIAGSVPLLLRARRMALTETSPSPTSSAATTSSTQDSPTPRSTPEPKDPADTLPGKEAPTEKLRLPGLSAAGDIGRPTFVAPARGRFGAVSEAAIDQLWLRCAAVMGSAMGAATVAIALATYLMAVGSGGAAWVFFGIAALVTGAMPAIPVFYLRQLRALVDTVD